VLAAILIALLFGKLYAGVHPWSRLGCGPGVTFSPTQCYVGWESVMTLVVNQFNTHLPRTPIWWRLQYAFGLVFLPALVAVLAYVLLTVRYGRALYDQPRCRKCGYMLRGLSRPQCPECGEHI